MQPDLSVDDQRPSGRGTLPRLGQQVPAARQMTSETWLSSGNDIARRAMWSARGQGPPFG